MVENNSINIMLSDKVYNDNEDNQDSIIDDFNELKDNNNETDSCISPRQRLKRK